MSYVGTEDHKRKIIILEECEVEGQEELVDLELPAKYEVCSRCDGQGKHDHPAFSNGISSDEWNGPDWDDDSREGYMSGRYDVTCEECKGRNVVLEVDRDNCPEHLMAEYDSWCDSMNHSMQEEAAERRMGC